ncbi:MAG: hypothetical protein ACI9Z3_000995, partial [Roseivirga sp.]
MLFAKWDSYDGNAEDNTPKKVGEEKPKASENDPYEIK